MALDASIHRHRTDDNKRNFTHIFALTPHFPSVFNRTSGCRNTSIGICSLQIFYLCRAGEYLGGSGMGMFMFYHHYIAFALSLFSFFLFQTASFVADGRNKMDFACKPLARFSLYRTFSPSNYLSFFFLIPLVALFSLSFFSTSYILSGKRYIRKYCLRRHAWLLPTTTAPALPTCTSLAEGKLHFYKDLECHWGHWRTFFSPMHRENELTLPPFSVNFNLNLYFKNSF